MPVAPDPDKVLRICVNGGCHMRAAPRLKLKALAEYVRSAFFFLPESKQMGRGDEVAVSIGKSGKRIRRDDAT